MTKEEIDIRNRRVDESIARYNAILGQKRAAWAAELRRRLIQQARDQGMSETAIRYLSK